VKRILFNATHPEELRVAVVDGQRLLDLDLESAVRQQKKGNIYKAVITRVEPSLEAAFVNYGAERHGFLPFKEIYRGYFQNYSGKTPISEVNISDVIKEGQELIVQVAKDERGNKGAALTTFISLAGRFLVLMPNNPKGGGISRRITGRQRSELKKNLDTLELESKHALIARTAAVDRTEEELRWDLEFLSDLWTAIEGASNASKAPILIYQESNLIVRTIRDSLNEHVQELIIDDREIFERAQRFVKQVMPHNVDKIKFHEGPTPLFSRFQIENQIESAFSREVRLRSGGSIVIDHTEALIAVDVNSAKATKGGDIEDTALNTNLEAVEEIARQLRIRDLGGLVVLDLIDMYENQNQRKVEAKLKESLRMDRARVQVGRISQFGMLEMSRQRLRSSIGDANYHSCPRCDGTGHIRSVVSNSLNLLRLIEDEAIKENTEAVQVYLSLESAAYLLNEKRRELAMLEARVATKIIVIPSSDFENPHFQIQRMRSNDLDESGDKPSYQLKADIDRSPKLEGISTKQVRAEKPLVGLEQMTHGSPPPTPTRLQPTESATAKSSENVGLFKRFWTTLTGTSLPAPSGQSQAEKKQTKDQGEQPRQNKPRQQNRRRNNSGNNDSNTNKPRNNNRRGGRGGKRNPQNRNRNPNQNRTDNNQGNKSPADNKSNANRRPKANNQANNKPGNKPVNKQAPQNKSPKSHDQADGNRKASNNTQTAKAQNRPAKKGDNQPKPTGHKAAEKNPAQNKNKADKPKSEGKPSSTTPAENKATQAKQSGPKRGPRARKPKDGNMKSEQAQSKGNIAPKAAKSEVDGNKKPAAKAKKDVKSKAAKTAKTAEA